MTTDQRDEPMDAETLARRREFGEYVAALMSFHDAIAPWFIRSQSPHIMGRFQSLFDTVTEAKATMERPGARVSLSPSTARRGESAETLTAGRTAGASTREGEEADKNPPLPPEPVQSVGDLCTCGHMYTQHGVTDDWHPCHLCACRRFESPAPTPTAPAGDEGAKLLHKAKLAAEILRPGSGIFGGVLQDARTEALYMFPALVAEVDRLKAERDDARAFNRQMGRRFDAALLGKEVVAAELELAAARDEVERLRAAQPTPSPSESAVREALSGAAVMLTLVASALRDEDRHMLACDCEESAARADAALASPPPVDTVRGRLVSALKTAHAHLDRWGVVTGGHEQEMVSQHETFEAINEALRAAGEKP